MSEHDELPEEPLKGRTYKLPICGLEPGSLRLDSAWPGSIPDPLLPIIKHNIDHGLDAMRDAGATFEDMQAELPYLAAGVAARVLAVALHGQTIEVNADIPDELIVPDPIVQVFGERNQG
jgi:hypothetical protein